MEKSNPGAREQHSVYGGLSESDARSSAEEGTPEQRRPCAHLFYFFSLISSCLNRIDEKMSGGQSGYELSEAKAILTELKSIRKAISSGEKEKQDLMQSLAKLQERFHLDQNMGSWDSLRCHSSVTGAAVVDKLMSLPSLIPYHEEQGDGFPVSLRLLKE